MNMDNIIKKAGVIFFIGIVILSLSLVFSNYDIYFILAGFILMLYSILMQKISIKSSNDNIKAIFYSDAKQRIFNFIFVSVLILIPVIFFFYVKERIKPVAVISVLGLAVFVLIIVYRLRIVLREREIVKLIKGIKTDGLSHPNSVIKLVGYGLISKEEAKFLLGLPSRIVLSKKEHKGIEERKKAILNKIAGYITPATDTEVKETLEIADEMLAKLSEEEIDRFLASKDFQKYKKVMGKYKIE